MTWKDLWAKRWIRRTAWSVGIFALVVIGYGLAILTLSWPSIDWPAKLSVWKEWSEIVRNFLFGLGVPLAGFGAWLAWRRTKSGEGQAGVAADRQVTETFAQAVGFLASDHSAVRIGGIFALERIARSSERDHWTIMETLAAFVRDRGLPYPDKEQTKLETFRQPEDLCTALLVLGRRRVEWDGANLLNLTEAYLPCLHVKGADFSQFDLTEADLRDAEFSGVQFRGTIFLKTRLESAFFLNCDLTGAKIRHAALQDAKLIKSSCRDVTFVGSRLQKTLFDRTDLTNSNLGHTQGLTQAQIDKAHTDPDNPPRLPRRQLNPPPPK